MHTFRIMYCFICKLPPSRSPLPRFWDKPMDHPIHRYHDLPASPPAFPVLRPYCPRNARRRRVRPFLLPGQQIQPVVPPPAVLGCVPGVFSRQCLTLSGDVRVLFPCHCSMNRGCGLCADEHPPEGRGPGQAQPYEHVAVWRLLRRRRGPRIRLQEVSCCLARAAVVY